MDGGKLKECIELAEYNLTVSIQDSRAFSNMVQLSRAK